jgi:hypothetical protein
MIHGRADSMASGVVRAISCASSLLPEIVGHVCTAGIKVQNATIWAPIAANKDALEFLLCRSITLQARSTFPPIFTFFSIFGVNVSLRRKIIDEIEKQR